MIANNTTTGTLNVAGGAYVAITGSSFGPATLSLNGGTLAAAQGVTTRQRPDLGGDSHDQLRRHLAR